MLASVRIWSPAAIVIAVGLTVTGVAFEMAKHAEERRVYKAFQLRVEWRAQDLQAKILLTRHAMVATAIHAAAAPKIDAEEFRRFTSQEAAGTGTIRSIAWIERITRDQRASFEARLGGPIVDRDANGKLVPAPERDEYAPLVIQSRLDGAPLAIGLDILTKPTRSLLLNLTRDSGLPKSNLMHEHDDADEPTYVTFWPIFDTDVPPQTVAERRAHLRGYVDGVFRVVDVLNGAIANTPKAVASLDFYLGDLAERQDSQPPLRLVATYSPSDDTVRATKTLVQTAGLPGGFHFTRSFDVRGQPWRVEWFYAPATVAAERSTSALTLLGAGLLLTSLLAAHLLAGKRRMSLVNTLVEQRTAEMAQTNTKLETLIDASPHAIVCLDPDQKVILWNAAAEHQFGYRADEVIGQPYPLVLPEETDEFDRRFERLAAGEVLRNLPSHRRHRDGNAIDTSSSAAAFYDATGAIEGIIFVIEDARERNQVQNQLRQAQKMEAIGQLTGGLAHDFNNLLAIVLGNLDLLAERYAEGTEDRELTDAATDAALRGAELTRQLLAFSRRQPLAPKLTYLAPVLESTAKLLRRTLGTPIVLELRIADDVWPIMVDVTQLESTLLNLAINARDAMPVGGRLCIEAINTTIDGREGTMEAEAPLGDYVVIAVSDTGSGMPPEILAKVFEPFFTTKGIHGTGLGLSMVHGFLKQSGGFTKVYSEPGHGTTIRLFLPRSLAALASADHRSDETPVSHGQEMVLVVEDSKSLRELALKHLQSLGYRTLPAADGADALKIIEGGAPIDLLFTDVVMPGGLDGRALAQAARRLRPDLKVLFTSGFTAAAASASSEDQFGSRLLSKPYRKDELARRIRAAIDASSV